MLLILPAIILQRITAWWRRVTGQDARPRYSYTDTGGNPYRRQGRDSAPQPAPKKKIFNKNEGEYVDFEEITVTASGSATEQIHYETEEQVSDAEWTEIK